MSVRRIAPLMIAVGLSIGCGQARRSEPLMGPLTLASDAERGRTTFMRYCHSCHPGGEAGLGPSLNDKALPTFLKSFQVRKGIGSMPSFSKEEISDQELDGIMAYLEALRDHGGEPGQ